jgi:hypothetical protein
MGKAKKYAKELIKLFNGEQPIYYNPDNMDEADKCELYFAKRCAEHCVNEIIKSHSSGNWKGLAWDKYWDDVKYYIKITK